MARRRRAKASTRSNPTRRRRRRSSPRRRTTRRRRRNPGFDLLGAGLGLLAGAALGAGAYALEGATLAPTTQAAIVGIGGAVAGIGASALNKSVGAGIAGAGGALATVMLVRHFMESKSTEQTSALRWRQTRQLPGYTMRGLDQGAMGAVTAQSYGRRVVMR